MYDYEKLSSTQLREKLKNFTEQLEELEEERQFVLGQTGYHLSGAAVKKYEAEVSELKKRIKAIEEIMTGVAINKEP